MHTTNPASFVDALMKHIVELAKIPKVQVERAVGPVLGMFIADVLSAKLDDQMELISPEFPLRKLQTGEVDNYQSTNIDWLLYSSKHNDLVLCELKTTDTTFDVGQVAIYQAVIRTICESGSQFLFKDLRSIRDRSLESGKYDEVIHRVSRNERYGDCTGARLVYIGPAVMKETQSTRIDSSVVWLNFGDLPSEIDSRYREEWSVIQRHLAKLDTITRRSRNGSDENTSEQNFAGRCSFSEIVQRCREMQDTVIVGFLGGASGAASGTLDDLKSRSAYKWDYAENGRGVKDVRNWIPGRAFLDIVERLEAKAGGV